MRNIFIVNCSQVVTTENHPEGLFKTVDGFPKNFDSLSYASEEAALNAAKSAYYAQLGINYGNINPNRVMQNITLEMGNGRQIMRDSMGFYPEIVVPEPEEPEEPENPEEPVEE